MKRIIFTLTKQRCRLLRICSILLIWLSCSPFLNAQNQNAEVQQAQKTMKRYIGIIHDNAGQTVIGASVMLKGSKSVGAVTGVDGKFSIVAPDGSTLVISCIGMTTQEIKLGEETKLNIILAEDTRLLDEVVVTGYQNIGRIDMTGSYTTLDAKDVVLPNYTSIDQMLQGQVAGMVVTNTSNRVGSSPTITLRGTSSLLGTTSPLWVVDGIIQQDAQGISSTNPMITGNDNDLQQYIGSSISWLNPNDIETITVLKDASATAIYGSRASNGVIVITTKKGTPGKTSVSYSANMTVGVRPTYDDYYVMNSQERVNFSKEAFDAGAYYNNTPFAQMNTYEGLMQLYMDSNISESQFIERYNYLETANTNWLKLLTRTSISHKHHLNVSGGSEKFTHNLSVNYNRQEGTEKGNEGETYSARLRLGMDLSSRLNIDFSLAGTVGKTEGFISTVNPLSYAINTSRAIPAYDENGDYLFYQKTTTYKYNSNLASTGLGYNILNEKEYSSAEIKSSQINATMNADYKILKDGSLRYNLVAGYTNNRRTSEAYSDERTFDIANRYRGYDYGSVEDASSALFKSALMPHGGELVTDNNLTWSYNIQNKLLYNNTFNKVHRVNAMFATEVRSSTYESNTNTILGYLKYKGGHIVIPPSVDQIVPITGSISDWGLLNSYFMSGVSTSDRTDNFLSFFTSLSYTYDNKYVFNFSIRNDASNRFGQDQNKQFDPTYSFGGAWHASEERFMAGLRPLLSRLSLKATFGIQGNALTSISPELILKYPSLNGTYNQYTSTISSLPNPYLTWERTKTGNFGLNLGLFNNKLNVDVDGYFRNSNPVSYMATTPEYGGSSVPKKGAKLSNSGIEVTLTGNVIKTKDIMLSLSTNFSKNWNKVTSVIQDDSQSISTSSYLQGNTTNTGIILEKGYSVNGFWSYAFDGLDPETGYALFKNMDMTDYESIADFLVYSGSKEPFMSAGININFSYKSFSLATGLAANLGGKQRLPNPYSSFNIGLMPSAEVNLSKELLSRWKKPGDENYTTIPSVYTGGNITVYDPSNNSATSYNMWSLSDDRVVSSSFLRCRQISLSWHAPRKFTEPLHINSLSLSGTCSNIFVIASSRYNGMDPETGTSVMPRSFSLGFNISF